MRTLLVCLALAACSQGPVRVYLDQSTTPADVDPAAAAATLASAVEWWRGCGYDVALELASARIRFGDIPGNDSASGATASDGGFVLRGREQFWAADGTRCVNRMMLGQTMRHELGHLLGMRHEPEPWSVMNADASVCVERFASESCHPEK